MRKILVASLGLLSVAAMPQVAVAADLPVKAPVAPLVVPFSWTGFYVGANVGYSSGRASTDLGETSVTSTTATITTLGGTPLATATDVSPPVVFAGSDRARMNGWLAGLQAGYNWQTDRWVWGLEGDLQATGQRGGTSFCFPLGTPCGAGTTAIGTANYSLPWLGTLRGRTGVTFDRLLLYVTGGLAVGQVRADFSDGIAATSAITPAAIAAASSNVTRLGWVLGAGVEGAVSNNWSVKLEYLHVDLGSVGASVTGTANGSFSAVLGDFRTFLTQTTTFNSAFRARVTDDIIRIGVNYRFGGPVVARY